MANINMGAGSDPVQIGLPYQQNPFGLQSNQPFPGESMEAYQNRLFKEFYARNQNPLPAGYDAQMGRGPGPLMFPGPLPASGIRTADGKVLRGTVLADGTIQGTVTFADGTTREGKFSRDPQGYNIKETPDSFNKTDAEAKLEKQRELAFGSLAEGSNIFRGDLGQNAREGIQRILSGEQVPFTNDVVANMFSARADAAGAGAAQRDELIRRSFANRGLGGGGGELQSLLDSGRQADAELTQAQRDLQTTQAMENFSARERAMQSAGEIMSRQAAAEAPFRLKEADMRSRFEITGQEPLSEFQKALISILTRSGGGPTSVGASSQLGTATGGGGGGGGSQPLGGSMIYGPSQTQPNLYNTTAPHSVVRSQVEAKNREDAQRRGESGNPMINPALKGNPFSFWFGK